MLKKSLRIKKNKMKEAYSKAKQFFEEEWNDKKIKIHSACVIECCNSMIKDTNLNPIVFDVAGWIHDIGRKDNKDKHHIIGLDYLDKFLNKYPEFESLKEEISDCILNHRREQKPNTIYGKIMQVADKVSLHHKDWLRYVDENNKSN